MNPKRRDGRRKCVGCGQPAMHPTGQAEKKYCEQCWDERCRQVHSESEKFGFWRIGRSTDAELWGVSHPDAKSKGGGQEVGEVWIMENKGVHAVWISAYLEPSFDWKKKFVLLFQAGVSTEETYVELLIDRTLGFFETTFAGGHIHLSIAFLTGEGLDYDV